MLSQCFPLACGRSHAILIQAQMSFTVRVERIHNTSKIGANDSLHGQNRIITQHKCQSLKSQHSSKHFVNKFRFDLFFTIESKSITYQSTPSRGFRNPLYDSFFSHLAGFCTYPVTTPSEEVARQTPPLKTGKESVGLWHVAY